MSGDIDTLLVVGGISIWTGESQPRLLGWLRQQSKKVRRLGSVCTGAFVLARAGLLDGRRATTHWCFTGKLKEDYPKIVVDPDPIFIRDGKVVTAAGVAAGIDLCLSLVEEDLGLDIALRVARALVLFVRRSGGSINSARLWRSRILPKSLSVNCPSGLSKISPNPWALTNWRPG